jgi:hypothetical protein
MKLYNTKEHKHFFFIILVCEMEATGLIKKIGGCIVIINE